MKNVRRELAILAALMMFVQFGITPSWAATRKDPNICPEEGCGGITSPVQPYIPLYPGWPKSATSGHPVTADLNGDGKLEVLVAGGGSRIYCFRENGTLLWQRTLDGYTATSPVVADLDPAYPGLEIVTTTGGESSGGTTWGSIFVIHADGTNATGWPVNAQGFASTPALADFNGDGTPEIVVGSRRSSGSNGFLHILRANGTPYPGWNPDLGFYGGSAYAIADLDRYGTLEIVVAIHGKLSVYHADGRIMPGWPKDVYVNALPALGDIDGDGDLEIVVAGSGNLQAFHHTGFPVRGWPVSIGSYMGNPVIGNLDNTGTSEIMIGDGNGYVHVFRADGSYASGWPKLLSTYATEPIFADLDGNGTKEIVVGSTDRNLYAFYADGNSVAGFPVTPGSAMYQYSAAVADLNGDGHLEILVAPGSISIWTLPWISTERLPWPMFRKDERRTGSEAPPVLGP